MEERISILKSEYESLLEDAAFLQCLQAAGVDNWNGYEQAIDLYQEDQK